MCYIVFIKVGFLGNFGDNLAVVIGNSENVGKSFGNFTTAASEFTAYCNYCLLYTSDAADE